MNSGYSPIGDYAVIGDCHSAALVSRTGSIDWYCPVRFDAPAVFCRLLDAKKGGYFSVAPAAKSEAKRCYLGSTNILQTTFRSAGAEVRLTDFMTVHHPRTTPIEEQQICRLVECESNECELELRFRPTFDFGQRECELTLAGDTGLIAHAGRQYLALYSPKFELERHGPEIRGRLRARRGEHAWLALTSCQSKSAAERALARDISMDDLRRAIHHWESWAERCNYEGPYKEAVVRSALVLKLLTYQPTGAVVAAPTTSLPEDIGGVRNWDYRYVWLRDAALCLFALSTLGYHNEADDFMQWLIGVCGRHPHRRPQTMYTLDGGRKLTEELLEHLDGYRGSRPVRVGNAASEQAQLDIYGDILSAAYHFHHVSEPQASMPAPPPEARLARRNWQLLEGLIDQAAELWSEPDHSIWEVRAEPRHFVYSKLMCWVALDRGIRLAAENGMTKPVNGWKKARSDIRRAILERGYNEKLGAFTQVLDGNALDASLLAIPRFGFLSATDPRVQSTIDAIQRSLMRDGLVERYRAHDGLPGDEGTFALCSFWLVDALALSGRTDEARELFERLLSYRNDVGLLSEELDPPAGANRLIGNFPQGFSHMALIGSATNLAGRPVQSIVA